MEPVVSCVQIRRDALWWFDDRVVDLDPSQTQWDRNEPFVVALTQLLYTYFYCASRPVLRREIDSLARNSPTQPLTPDLAAANPGKGRRERDWECVQIPSNSQTFIVRKGGLSVSAPAHYVRSTNLGAVSVGKHVIVDAPSGSMNRSAGYYVAHSDADFDYSQSLSRIYINIRPDAAAALLRDVCCELNATGQQFDLKIANDAAYYHRSDVAVLYSPRARLVEVWLSVRPILVRYSAQLRSPVPALVRRLLPGVGAADDPSTGSSFGLDRCQAVAIGLARSLGERSSTARLRAISSAMVEQDIDPDAPYLTAHRADSYAAL